MFLDRPPLAARLKAITYVNVYRVQSVDLTFVDSIDLGKLHIIPVRENNEVVMI